MQGAFYKQCQFKWLHLLNARVAPMNHARRKTRGEVNFHRGAELESNGSPVPERTTEGTNRVWEVDAFMDTLTVPNNKHKLIWMLIYSLSAISFPSFFFFLWLCKTINSKGTLRSGSYTLFILGNDKSLWCNGFFFFWRRVLLRQTNKYRNAHWGGGGDWRNNGKRQAGKSITATFQKKCTRDFVRFLLIQRFN